MANAKHSPLPWSAVFQDDPRGNCSPMYVGLVCIIEAGENGISVVADCGYVAKEDWAANAAFIVKAVNSHDALVGALKKFTAFADEVEREAAYGGCTPEEWGKCCPWGLFATARAALQLAGEASS